VPNLPFSRMHFPVRRTATRGGAPLSIMTCLAVVALISAVALVAAMPAKSRTNGENASAPNGSAPAGSHADQARIRTNYATLPLAFEPNVGQTDPQVTYMARGRGYSLLLTANAAYFAIPLASPHPDPAAQSAHPEKGLYLIGRGRGTGEELRSRGLANRKAHNSAASIEMDMLGSNPTPQIIAENQLPGVTNYILGRDPSKWHSGVAHYGQVRYHEVYPGVDLAYHGASESAFPGQNKLDQNELGQNKLGQNKFEFDFLVNPGADPEAVTLGFRGVKALRTTAAGDLVLASAAGDLYMHRPFAYQERNGVRQPIDARFVIHRNDKDDNRVSFALANYDRSRQVVIDPTVTYSTYLGGSLEDDGNAITADSSGNAYITGETDSANFTGATGAPAGGRDVFVTELSPTGTLIFTTLVGGTADDIGNAIAVDTKSTPPGIYVTGQTGSADFPTPGGTVQPTFLGVTTVHGFLFKLSSNGSSLLWSTFIEGSDGEGALGLALARDAVTTSDDDVYVVGGTLSADLGSNTAGVVGTVNPLPGESKLNLGAGDTGLTDGFIAKVKNGGTSYLFLSYLGGSDDDVAYGVAIDSTGKVYVAGQTASPDFPVTSGVFQATCGTDGKCNASGGNTVDDAFVSAITSGNTPAFVYSTYLGGENKDDAFAIAVDSASNAYVTGQTFSTKFPTKNSLTGLSALVGTQDVFVASLNPAGTALNYSTYLGGSGAQAGSGIAVDGSGNAYVTGFTTSSNFPTTAATQSAFGGGDSSSFDTDAFVTELNLNGSSLSLPFSTYLGGSGDEDFVSGALAVDGSGNIYVTGETNSPNFPLTNAADGKYNAGSSQTCTLASGGNPVPCPDAFATVYAPAVSGDFSIAGTPLAAVNPGSPSTSTITVTPFHGYSNTVNLTCSVSGGGTPAPTCAFSSSSIAGGSGTSMLTVSTTAATSELLLPGSHRGVILYASLLPIVGFAVLGLAPATRKSRFGAFLCLFVLLSGILILPACGGGSSSSSGGGGGGGGSTGTPAGTYTITVTGSDGTISHSIAPALTLTVN
jgi:beta-propeller repeat-containing protein